MTTDNFCFHLQNRLIQTSQTGGQQYSDASPFSIPCSNPQPWNDVANILPLCYLRWTAWRRDNQPNSTQDDDTWIDDAQNSVSLSSASHLCCYTERRYAEFHNAECC
jgi:hypothetical protein